MKGRILRYALLLSAWGWGMSFFFTFTSWQTSSKQLYQMGANAIEYQPLLDYWLKMASSTFGCLGILFFIVFLNPKKYFEVLWFLGTTSIFVGVVLACSAYFNELKSASHPTYMIDIGFCLVSGLAILLTKNTAKKEGTKNS